MAKKVVSTGPSKAQERRWQAESLALNALKNSPVYAKMVREAEKSIKALERKAK